MPTIIHGDCIEAMREMPENSIDSIVTDPPYGLGFMGKKWDDLPPGREWAEECLRVLKPGGHMLAFGGSRTWHRLAVAIEDAGFEMRDSIAWLYGSGMPKGQATLKPAFEPVVMARKPFGSTLSSNEAIHGTGALSIDACRIDAGCERYNTAKGSSGFAAGYKLGDGRGVPTKGRWPANVILDEAQESALVESRYFYCAKASKHERPFAGGAAHPTVKPLSLMRYLVKLVTPLGGIVLEPFAGSGATVEACMLEGFDCIAIEREAEYLPLIHQRIERAA